MKPEKENPARAGRRKDHRPDDRAPLGHDRGARSPESRRAPLLPRRRVRVARAFSRKTRSTREVRALASRLTELGCDIVTGGGPGLMEAANEGAASSRGNGKPQDALLRPDDRDSLRESEPVSRQRDGAPDVLFAAPPLRAHVTGLRDLSRRHRDGARAHDGLAASAGRLHDGAPGRAGRRDVAGAASTGCGARWFRAGSSTRRISISFAGRRLDRGGRSR